MKEAIAIINQKGGVGKSTTALAIGAGLMLKGFKVLFIDLDAQCNLSYCMKADSSRITAFDLLTRKANAKQAIQHTTQGDIIAASNILAGFDTELKEAGKEYRLKEALDPVKEEYDYLIIDTPPALGMLTVMAMTASTGIIIPAQADVFSLQGIIQLNATIQAVQEHTNPDLKVKGILLTRFNARTILGRDIEEATAKMAGEMGTKLYKAKIRECIAIKEAQISQQDIFSYSPGSNASKDYKALVNELIKGK